MFFTVIFHEARLNIVRGFQLLNDDGLLLQLVATCVVDGVATARCRRRLITE